MGQLFLRITQFRRAIRPRYIFAPVLLTSLLILLPGLVSIDPNWVPVGSIEDQNQWGYSNAFSALDGYNISPLRESMVENQEQLNSFHTLLIIASPERDITRSEANYLEYRIENGYPTLIIGPQTAGNGRLRNLINPYIFIFDDEQVYDFDQNGGYPASPIVEPALVNDRNQFSSSFVSIVPLSLGVDIFYRDSFFGSLLNTLPTSESSSCILSQEIDFFDIGPCNQQHSIAARIWEFIVLTDTWMLRNNYTDAYPQNLNLLPMLINSFNNRIDSIVFDETHLDWIPVNPDGLRLTGYQLLTGRTPFMIYLALSAIIPFVVGMFTRAISFRDIISDQRITARLKKRLDTIHVSSVPAVPLSMEEKILVDEFHRTQLLGKGYLSKVAKEYLDLFQEQEITPPVKLLENLSKLSTTPLDESTSWRIIQDANHFLFGSSTKLDE